MVIFLLNRSASVFRWSSPGFDPDELDAVGEEDPVLARFPVAAGLIQKANCRSCHLAQGRLVGPGFDRIAERYRPSRCDGWAGKKLFKVGVGSGVKAMPPNALITENEAREILKYILSVGQESARLALSGAYQLESPGPDADQRAPGEEIAHCLQNF